MCVFPDSEDRQRPIYRYRNQRKEQPESRDRLDLVDRTPEGVNKYARRQSEVDSETARAYCHLVSREMERALGDLMTDVTEECVDRRGDARQV